MLKSKTFLGIDFGAGTLKAAEFAPGDGGGLKLTRFAVKALGLAGSQDAAREGAVKKGLAELVAEGGFSAKEAVVSAPGFQVFSKFVKLPPVDTSKVTQIIQYEAQQNVPFPLAETAWDYQILGTSGGGELEVLLVAIKSDVVEKLFAQCEGAGLRTEMVDASMGALANAFRYNYSDLEGCSLLIDLGAKTSNVLLFEKNKFYARSINVGANAITQEFGAEAKLPFAEAEKFKIAEGFVSLGGAYEEPDNPKVAAVSKVARNVLTRLHLQVNQTIQFYRTQQGGAAPVRVFLCGGGSIMPYATQFFQEKLNLTVEYFNPFRNVPVDPSVNVAELEKYAQCFGEVVGLGLRNIAQCPVELDLTPKASKARQEFGRKKPYLVGALAALAIGAFAYGGFATRVASVKQQALDEIKTQLEPLERVEERLKAEEDKLKKASDEVSQLAGYAGEKTEWIDILTEYRRIMMHVEDNAEKRLGRPVGIWIDKLVSVERVEQETSEDDSQAKPSLYRMDPLLMKRYGLWRPGMMMPGMPGAGGEEGGEGGEGGSKAKAKNTNEVALLTFTMRGVNLKKVSASTFANAANELAFDLEKELKASPLFDDKETKLDGNITEEDDSPTFKFDVKVKLKKVVKL